MNKGATYSLEVLEKIGVPLMESLIAPVKGQESHADMAVQIAQDAQNMASLLARSVATSIDLSTVTEIEELGENSDALRVALAGLAAPLVADLYRANGAVPDEKQTERITSALKSVMSFSKNFTPGIDEISRLGALKASGEVADKYQISVQYMQALTPVVNVVSDADALGEIAKRLTQCASEIRRNIHPDANDAEASRVEMGALRALGVIYAACHKEISGDQKAVWEAFNLRSTVLSTLTRSMVLGEDSSTDTSSAAGVVTPTAPPVAPIVEPPPVIKDIKPVEDAQPPIPSAENKAAPETPTPPSPPEADTPEPAAEPPPAQKTAGNPMAVFAKKDAGEENSTPTPETPPPPPEADTPEPPPAAEPPEAEPAADPPPDAENKSSDSGNPMSFFSSKPKDSEE